MLAELEALFRSSSPEMRVPDYRRLVVGENVLAKPTRTTREHSIRKLKALYGRDSEIAVFRILRRLWDDAGSESRPLLAMLCAQARDPLLRLSSPPVLETASGTTVDRRRIEEAVASGAPERFSESSTRAIARNVLSSFTQSGHLEGRTVKVRVRARATPVSATYAFVLAYLEGYRAQRILGAPWSALLDATPAELGALAQAASRRGLCDFRQVGDVVELRFPALLTSAEEQTGVR